MSEKPKKSTKNKPPVDSKPKRCALELVKPRLCPECTQGNGKKRRKIDGDKITEKYQKKIPYELFRGWKLDANLIVPETCSQCGSVLDEANYILELKYQGQQAPARLELSCPEDLAMIQFLFGGKGINFQLFRILWDSPDDERSDRLMELYGVTDETALNDAIDRQFATGKK